MRVLSVAMWQSLVYCVITLAMLGFGVSGAFLSVWRAALSKRQHTLLCFSALGFAVSNLVTLYLAGKLTVDAFKLADNPRMGFPLLAYFALLSLPYFFGGAAIGLAFTRNPALMNKLYCANMMGSGAGCVTFLLLISPVGAPVLLFAVSAISAVAAALFALPSWRRGVILSCSALFLIAVISPMANRILTLKVCESKVLGNRLAAEPETKVELTRWTATGRVDVLSGPALVFNNRRTGLSFPYKEVVTDGDAYTRLFQHPGTQSQPFVPYDKFGLNSVYKLIQSPKVLVIGLGAGKDISEALGLGAREVVAVEFNPAIVTLVKSEYADYIGNTGADPRVRILLAEGRSYVRGSPPNTFDVLFMNGVDTFAALSSGAYTTVENYLYTVEAFYDYLRVLKPDGIISISRLAFRQPREMLRLTTTALQALREEGIREPWTHTILVIDYDWGTLLVKRSPFSPAEIEAVERLADEGWFRIAYRPGLEEYPLSPSAISRYGQGVAEPAPYADSVNPDVAMVKAFKDGTESRFYNAYQYEVRPVRDDNPFFFKYYKWAGLVSRTGDRIVWNAAGGSLALAVLAFLLVGAGVAVAVLIFLPLYISRRVRGELTVTLRALRFAIYFCALGIGFMFIEISLMQKFTLFLAHPTYAIATVLSSILVFSGIGSLCGTHIPLSDRKLVTGSIVLLCAFIVCYTSASGMVFARLLSLSILFRNVIGAAMIAPLAFVMGIPFPTGLRAAQKDAPALVPWAWGVNGGASVLASVLAVLLAMHAGFSAVLYSAAIIYLIGWLAIAGILNTRSGRG